MTNQTLIDDWLAWMASGTAAASTLRQRRYIIGVFAARHDLLAVTTDDVQAHLGAFRGGPEGRKSVLSTLRGFYKWALAADLIDRDPTRLARPITVNPGVPKPLPEAVLRAALARADQETTVMLLLGAYAGLRRAEIAGLHRDNVTDIGLVVTGKGSKPRRIPVHPLLRPHLGVDGWFFPSPRRAGQHVSADYVASRICAVLPHGWTAHNLRHRFATQAYRSTKDIRAVQQLLGHASPTTTARYVMVDEDSLEAAVMAVA